MPDFIFILKELWLAEIDNAYLEKSELLNLSLGNSQKLIASLNVAIYARQKFVLRNF